MNMRDLIKQLRYTAEVLEQLVGDSVIKEREWIAKDEQGLGKTVHMNPDYPSYKDFMLNWSGNPVPYRWSSKKVNKKQEEGRMKRSKVHWTKRPENKERLAKIVKKMIAGKKAKNGKK